MTEHRYAVVVPAYEKAATIVTTLTSALADPGVTEVIVVDDGSTDGTPDVVRAVDDPRVTLVEQANAGPGAARNAGARRVAADRIVFLDGDDELLPGATSVFDEGRGLLVRTGAIVALPDGSERTELATDDPRPFPRGTPYAGTFAVDRELFDRVGGYDPAFRYGENSEVLLRLQAAAGGTAFVGRPTLRWNKDPVGRGEAYLARRLAAIELMLSKHADAFADDPESAADHWAIASNLYRSSGNRRRAARAAAAALRRRPTEPRSWARLGRSVLR